MKTSKGSYLPVDARFPFGGLNHVTPTTQLQPGESTNAVNLMTFRGSLKKRSGYSRLGGVVGAGDEPILSLFNYQDSRGYNWLMAHTGTKLYSYDGTTWVDRTPVTTVVKLTKLGGGNGWSVTAGAFVVGQFVTQAVSGASGVWLADDASFYYVAVTYGVLNATGAITVVATSGTGTLTLTGAEPTLVAVTAAKLPIKPVATTTTGWIITTGAFDPGNTVLQEESGATGVWLAADATYYYVKVVSGTFDNTHTLSNTTTGLAGSLELDGTWPATVSGGVALFPLGSWTLDGTFTVGDQVIQSISGAQGTWVAPDGSNYKVTPTYGTFDTTNQVDDAEIGVTATITFHGVTAAASTQTVNLLATTTKTMAWTGTEDNYIAHAVSADVNLGRVAVLVNGVNWPIYWDGAASTAKVLPVNIPSFCTAKAMGVYNSYLVFANITTQTDVEQKSFMWSDTGNFVSWLTGNSGVLAETAFLGEVLRVLPYADKLIVFSRNSIGCLCYINPEVIFGTQIYVTATNLVGPEAVVDTSPYIVYVGQDNIYLWNGNSLATPIGDKIAPLWRSIQNSDYIHRTKVEFDKALNQIRLIVPTGSATNRVFTMEIIAATATSKDARGFSDSLWLEHEYATVAKCFGLDMRSTSGRPFFNLVVGSTAGRVFIEGGETNDVLDPITVTWDTCDFVIPQTYESQFARWYEVEFEASGTSTEVWYSIDRGVTWTLAEAVDLVEGLTHYRVNLDTVSRQLRIRFTQSTLDSTFELTWYKVWFRPGGAR